MVKTDKFESSVNKRHSRASQKILTKIPPDLYYAPRVSHWGSTFHFCDSHSQVLFSSVRNGHFFAYIYAIWIYSLLLNNHFCVVRDIQFVLPGKSQHTYFATIILPDFSVLSILENSNISFTNQRLEYVSH